MWTNAVVDVLDRRNQTSQIQDNYNKQLCRFLLIQPDIVLTPNGTSLRVLQPADLDVLLYYIEPLVLDPDPNIMGSQLYVLVAIASV